MVRNGGWVSIVGIPVEGFITLNALVTRRKGLTIKMSCRFSHPLLRGPRVIKTTFLICIKDFSPCADYYAN